METVSRMWGHWSPSSAIIPKSQGALRIGTLGAAKIAPMALIYPAIKLKDVEVVAVAARNYDQAKKFATKHKINKVHETYQQLIEDPDIDAVYNPLPNSLHCEWTIKALRAGKHVLCEKPLGSNRYEAAQMKQAADETGKILFEAFHYRYHPATQRILEILRSGEIGTIQKLELWFHIPGAVMFSSSDIRYNFGLAGGSMMDFGCYAINFIRLVVGEEPDEITKAHATKYNNPEIDGRMEAEMKFPSGITASIDVALRSWKLSNVAHITGSAGKMIINGLPLVSVFHSIEVQKGKESSTEKVYGNGESTYYYQLDTFTKLVKGENVEYTTTAEDGIKNMKVIDDIYLKAGLKVRGIVPTGSGENAFVNSK